MSLLAPNEHSKKIRKPIWTQHKKEIIQVYIHDDETLERVMSVMAKKHGFAPTIAQYKRQIKKWGVRKNHKSEIDSEEEVDIEELGARVRELYLLSSARLAVADSTTEFPISRAVQNRPRLGMNLGVHMRSIQLRPIR